MFIKILVENFNNEVLKSSKNYRYKLSKQIFLIR